MRSIYIDPETRDIVLAEDGPQRSAAPVAELLLAIGIVKDSFHGDPDQGSRIPLLVTGEPPVDARNAVESAGREALERLVAQGAITVANVAYSPATRELLLETDAATLTLGL